jgi:hypothetical protein
MDLTLEEREGPYVTLMIRYALVTASEIRLKDGISREIIEQLLDWFGGVLGSSNPFYECREPISA